MWHLVLTVIWYLQLTNSNGEHCLLCDNAVRPEFCDTVRPCGNHEKCFIDTMVLAAGTIRYNLGCRDVTQCTTTNVKRKRNLERSTAYLVCSECCTGDLCNSAGCGNSGYPTQRGPICYNCEQQTSEEDCSTLKMCHEHQVCMLQKKTDRVTDTSIYGSKCVGAQECNDEIAKFKQLASIFIGKRNKREYLLSLQGSCLIKCCNTSLCNNNCNASSYTTASAYTSLLTQSATDMTPRATSTLMTLDPCLSNPCQRGTCSPYQNTYKCTCGYGIYGRNCELEAGQRTTQAHVTVVPTVATTHTEQNNCLPNPCTKGHCIETLHDYVCICNTGFEGRNCSKRHVTDCFDVLHRSMGKKSGVYRVNLWKSLKDLGIYCDLETSGGGWTVFQHRFNGSVDFFQNFETYAHGFGSLDGEFWLGLEYIYEMVSQGPESELRIDLMAADGSTAYELFQKFSLSPAPNYTLHIGAGSGNAGDSGHGLSYNDGYNFYTYDQDSSYACASSQIGHGGWWYNWCTFVNLNGQYIKPGTVHQTRTEGGMIYNAFQQWRSLKRSKMMFRRKSY